MEILDYWNQFRAIPYSDEILIGVGAVLLIWSVVKIVKTSLTMLIWVILSGIGLTALAQGLDQSPFELANSQKNNVGEYLNTGKEMSADVLEVLCRKLDETQFGVPIGNTN